MSSAKRSKPKRSAKEFPDPPARDVQERQDKAHTEEDFLADLNKAAERDSKPSEPDPKSPKR